MAISYTAPRVELDDFAKELNALDSDAKESLRRDLYGDYADIEETPLLLADSLIQLQEALEAIEPSAKEAFLRAKEECPDYVNSDDFVLPFLRAERFNASRAAGRIVSYWEQKVQLFSNGKDAFGPITVDMLQESDLAVLRNGGLSLLPKDQHGRAVIHSDREAVQLHRNGRYALVRALLYLMHVAAEDVSVQRRGMVLLSATRAPFTAAQFNRMAIKHFFQILGCGPIRNVVFHAVTGFLYASIAEMILPSALWLMGHDVRMRLKLHRDSSDQEIQSTFATYGITELPRSIGGLNRVDGEAWLRERKKVEEKRKSDSDI